MNQDSRGKGRKGKLEAVISGENVLRTVMFLLFVNRIFSGFLFGPMLLKIYLQGEQWHDFPHQ